MEIIVGSVETAEDMDERVSIGEYGQQKKAWKRTVERKEMKTQHNAVSPYGDTISISEAGKAASSEKESKLVNKDTTDGIVIRKETGKSEQKQESEASTADISAYTEL